MSPRFSRRSVAMTGAAAALLIFFPVPGTAQDSVVPAAEAWLAGQPKDSDDVGALAEKLTTPEAAFAYVRDHIAYEPYSGVMKGAAGALSTHGANDCDRALLLAALLAAQGIEVKLVRGVPAGRLADRGRVNEDATALLLASLPPTSPPLEPRNFEQKALRQLFVQQTRDRAALIRSASGAQDALLEPLLPAPARAPTATPSFHVWVQAEIDGKPVDLDPRGPADQPGRAPATAVDVWAPDELPDDLYQTVALHLVTESLAAGQLIQKELLTHSFRAADLAVHGCRLAILPRRNSADDVTDFRPLLLSGEEQTEGESFRMQGSPAAAPETAGAGGLLGGFGGAPTEPAAPATPGDPHAPRLARLWLEVVFHAPGLPDESIRRVLIDRAVPAPDGWKVGPELADDRAAARLLLQTWDGALDAGTPHPFALMQAELAALQSLDPLREALAAGHQPGAGDVAAPVLSPQLIGFFLASGLKRLQLAQAAGGVHSYQTRPRLAFLRHGYAVADWSDAAARPRYSEGIDLINAPFVFTGPEPQASRVARQAGIADTVLEQFVLNRPGEANTVSVFAAVHDQNLPLLTLRHPADLAQVAVPPAIRAALARELAAGHILIAPDRLLSVGARHRYGWWTLDPATGYLVGQMDLGGAQGLTEAEEINQKVAEWTEAYVKFLGNVLKCYQNALEDALGSVTVDAANVSVNVTVNHGDNPMPGGEQVVTCLRNAACDALKDFITEELNSAAVYQEAETVEEMLGQWVEQKAINKAGGLGEQACQQMLGGG